MSFELPKTNEVTIQFADPTYFPGMQDLCKIVYPFSVSWTPEQLASHQKLFPLGQFIAIDTTTEKVIGMAASLIIRWDDYETDQPWRDFTDNGYFTNHDPESGRTLYGAEVMVHPDYRGKGVGKLLYEARRLLVYHLKLLRIRAGARMRAYSEYSKIMTPKEYAIKLINFELTDPTITFQLKQGFKILDVVSNYLRHDPESMGYAALIEWLNPSVATVEHYEKQRKMIEWSFFKSSTS